MEIPRRMRSASSADIVRITLNTTPVSKENHRKLLSEQKTTQIVSNDNFLQIPEVDGAVGYKRPQS